MMRVPISNDSLNFTTSVIGYDVATVRSLKH